MGPSLLRNQRGMALLVTMTVLALLVVAVLEFNRRMQSELLGAAGLRHSVQLGHAARSALSAARAVLDGAGEENDHDSLRDDWARPETYEFLGDLFEEGELRVVVSDLSGRLQLNALIGPDGQYNEVQKAMFLRLLTSQRIGLEGEEAEGVLDALKDWLDGDDEVTGFDGAEESFYQGKAEPHGCRNGPLAFVEELLLVRGFSRELLYGSGEREGIARYVTAHGADGRININTAPDGVLLALAGELDDDMVADMIAYRGEEKSDLGSAEWYRNVASLPAELVLPAEVLSVQSVFFEVEVEARLGSAVRRAVALLGRRTDRRTELLSWKIM